MRYLEVRRHSKRSRPNQHLNQWGVALARGLGSQIGPFDHVVTSPLPRCVETAVAMGFAVDETIDQLAGKDVLGESFPAMDLVDWSAGCAVFQPLIAANKELADFVAAQAEVWRSVVKQVPKGGQALLVGHGGAFLDARPFTVCLILTILPGEPSRATARGSACTSMENVLAARKF